MWNDVPKILDRTGVSMEARILYQKGNGHDHLGCFGCRYRQSELVHARWAMLGVAGILVQEIVKPGVFWYYAGLPENLPKINFGGPTGEVRVLHTQHSSAEVSLN